MAISREFPSCSRHHTSSSESDHIHLDLLLLILMRLPVQTLLICRIVCKSWKEIIDSTSFILDHLAHQRPRILLQNNFDFLLLDPKNRHIYDTVRAPDGIDLGSKPSNLRAVSTVHGVVCLYDNGYNLFLWNPSIRRHMRIPVPPFEPSACRINYWYTDWYNYCGLWMDSCTKEFKVVIFYISEYEKGGRLFSSRDQKWQEIPEDEMAAFNGVYITSWLSLQVMINGVAHWVARNNHYHYDGLLVSYDFAQGKFGQISLPEFVIASLIYVSIWDGSLSIVVAEEMFPISTTFELYVLKNGLWSKMVTFSPEQGLGRVFCVLDCCTALASTTHKELVLYSNANDGSIVPLCSRKEGYIPLKLSNIDSLFSFTYEFVESLVFPD